MTERLRAGMWGSAGPALITLVTLLCFVSLGGDVWISVAGIVLLEALIGFVYGVVRSGWKPSTWFKAVQVGSLVWGCLVLPLICCGSLGAYGIAGTRLLGGNSFVEDLCYVMLLYCGQLLTGAVAGILIEYQQRQAGRTR